jgi:hypothetical protein
MRGRWDVVVGRVRTSFWKARLPLQSPKRFHRREAGTATFGGTGGLVRHVTEINLDAPAGR